MAMLDAIFGVRTIQQFFALYRKNALVAWRNRRATLLRLIAPFLFLLLALLVDKALQANQRSDQSYKDVRTPEVEMVSHIPTCHEDLYIGSRDCTELLYSPDNAVTRAIMKSVVDNNYDSNGKLVNITATAYPTQDAVQDFFLKNPDYAIAAVTFVFNETSPTALSGFLVQTNTTIKFFKDNYQDPNKFVQLPLQVAVHREITRHMLKQNAATASVADKLKWAVGLKTFPHPPIATVSVLGQVLGPFVFAAAMFGFVTQISTVVGEKELGLRQALRTMGMTDAAYWLSWGAWEVTLAFITGHLICIFGLILQFQLFLHNNYGLLFFLFFLFQLAMSSLALLLSAFISKTQVAVYVGFAMFIVGWIMQTVVLFGVPYSPDFYQTANYAITAVFALFPWTLLAKGFADLGSATITDSSPGLRWSERKSYCLNLPNSDGVQYDPTEQYINFQCVIPLNSIYWIFVGCWIGYLLFAIYFDNIVPNEHGVRKPFYYLFVPSYWFPSMARRKPLSKTVEADEPAAPDAPTVAVDEDVHAEESKMRSLLQHRTGVAGELAGHVEARNAVEVFGLKRMYKGKTGFFGNNCKWCGEACDCCNCEKTDDFWAIRGSWLSIAENQLFCLLGPNGAGKTTTINCLTGALPPTAGDALVHGESIRSVPGMDSIRSMMGVCPQFDVLWNELNGREHLQIYGSIKGLNWRKVKSDADALLEKVKLTYAAKQRAGSYSGGMKRRLSVAMALLGDPRIVYLDEPTTGMDPISRRYVWDIIQEAKVGRAIVLTTHSMEEADILGDRIAIMAKGRLRCIGSSIRLKQKFGSGYQVAVSVMPPSSRSVGADANKLAQKSVNIKQYFSQYLGLSPVTEGRMYIEYLVPRDLEDKLVDLMKKLEAERTQLGITDVQLSLTSLEEVFLNIAKQAELETARIVKVPLPDGYNLEVRAGEELVQDPRNGQMFKVAWETDEQGTLVVSDCHPAGESQAPANGASHYSNGVSTHPSDAHVAVANPAYGVASAYLPPHNPGSPSHLHQGYSGGPPAPGAPTNGAGAPNGNGGYSPTGGNYPIHNPMHNPIQGRPIGEGASAPISPRTVGSFRSNSTLSNSGGGAIGRSSRAMQLPVGAPVGSGAVPAVQGQDGRSERSLSNGSQPGRFSQRYLPSNSTAGPSGGGAPQ